MNPDSINELNAVMNTTKITNERIAHDAVRNKQYIIGSFSESVGFNVSSEPMVQYTSMQARQECKRLAKLNPGKTFIYVRLEGAEKVVPQPTTVSI